MRICLFTPNFLPDVGGAERTADRVARGLMERGHQVMVLAQYPSQRQPEPDLPYPVLRYRRPPRQNWWPGLLGRAVVKAHRRWPFEVMLAFYAYPTGYAGAQVKRRLNFGLVLTPRGGDLYPSFHGLKKWRVAHTIRAGYRAADRIATISSYTTERLHQFVGPPLPPLDVVPNGIDMNAHDALLQASRDATIPPLMDRPFVLHLARLSPVKQHGLALQAVERLRDRFESLGVGYAIVGEGQAMEQVQQFVRDRGLSSIVTLLGNRTGIEKAWLLDHARFLISTSREEGMPNVILEAMASGLPVLASDILPHRELIEDRGWGQLFRQGDAADLTEKLNAMLSLELEAYRQQALALRSRYTLDATIDGFEKSLRAACHKSIG